MSDFIWNIGSRMFFLFVKMINKFFIADLEIDGPRFFDPFTNSPYLFIFHWKLFILCGKIVNWGFEFEMKKKKGFVVFWFMVFQLCPITIKIDKKRHRRASYFWTLTSPEVFSFSFLKFLFYRFFTFYGKWLSEKYGICLNYTKKITESF